MKNLWTTIMVKNMADSLAFYTEVLGLEISHQVKAGPGMEIVFLGSGETKFELISNENAKDISYTNHVSTGFEVESADNFMSHLKDKGIDIFEGPFEPSPFIKYFFIKDPNGYKIQLVENKK
ncbi:MAG: VOC family protein [Clostridiales bacterium]|nr:VOC family protein [Clostridiales bacterium]